MSNLTALIDRKHVKPIAHYCALAGIPITEQDLKRDYFLLNHAARVEPFDIDAQHKLLQNLIDVRDTYYMFD